MKPFSERNLLVIGAIGLAVTVGIVVGALQYDKLPFLNQGKEYSAYFAEAGGLTPVMRPSRFRVSRWARSTSIELDGPRVLIKFTVKKNIRLGDRTEAAIKTKGLLGTKILEVYAARRRSTGRHDSHGAHDVAVSAAGCAGRVGDHDQRLEHQSTVGFAAGVVGDVRRHPAGAEDRGRGCRPVLGDTQRARCAAARPA